MLLLKKSTFTVEAESSVVSAEDSSALASAESIIAAAEAEAEQIKAAATKAYEEERAKGYEKGIADGKQEILMQKLDLVQESVKYMSTIENKVADIVLSALKKCIAEIGDDELVVQIVKKSMQAVVRTQHEIAIRVSPEMVPVVRSRIDTLSKDFPSVVKMDVVSDERLQNTACIVETEAGIVEASVDGQLEAIEKSIRKSFNNEAD